MLWAHCHDFRCPVQEARNSEALQRSKARIYSVARYRTSCAWGTHNLLTERLVVAVRLAFGNIVTPFVPPRPATHAWKAEDFLTLSFLQY
jgi:hypothetical protein